ncbi:hypothetical protein GCM10010191_67550 [Actinomadura vinacea]|uniref:DUF4304 domain-containing protein n=1 Tax=Actinomadura vinacea TaxID=115336 RepID=A0ABP5X0L7_9ACTN
MSSAEPETSGELKKEWVRREKKALGTFGFKSRPGNRYDLVFGDEWLGTIVLPKKADRGSTTVFYHPPGCALSHVPAQELIRELSGAGSKAPEQVTLPGGWYDIPSAATVFELQELNPGNLAGVEEAVARTTEMVEKQIIPWMRSKLSLDAVADSLSTPQATPSAEAGRLRSLAVIEHLRGGRERAQALLNEFTRQFGNTGIKEIDEPDNRFAVELQKLLDSAGRE